MSVERKPDTYSEEPQPFLRLYDIVRSPEMEENSDIVIKKLSPREGFMALVRSAFRLDITDRSMLTRQFGFLKRVVSRTSFRQLTFPREFKLLPCVCKSILADLKD